MPSHLLSRSMVVTAAILAMAGCGDSASLGSPLGEVEALTTPAGPSSAEPNLAVGPDGRVYLSWIEPKGDGTFELRFATLESGGWSAPRTIASGSDWFINWADFPAMTVLGDGRLAAHYLQRPSPTDGGTYSYGVRVVQSSDGGDTWSEPVTPHRDGAFAEHGFVSLFPAGWDSVGVVWLDGRSFVDEFGGTEEMSLRYAALGADGLLGPEVLIDARTCECCQTSVAVTDEGPVVAYRDRTEGEIRDIYVSRMAGAHWSDGRPVHRDEWEINGCPVNGPSIASDGRERVVVAWFTGARDTARVNVSFSDDRGDTFGLAIPVDQGGPVGRVDAAMLADGSALVSWIESGEGDGANVLLRRVAPDGRSSAPLVVTASSGARASGFPQMAVSGEMVVFAWTDPEDPSRVLTARAELEPLAR